MTPAAVDFPTLWLVAEKVLLPATVFLGGWAVRKLNAIESRQITIEARQVNAEHILTGVDGKNGIKSEVRLIARRVDAIEDRNIAIDAVVEAERQQWPHPDRREGARRMRDITHEVLDERARRATGEHPTDEE